MPIPFAPLVGLAIGALLAWIAAPELARDESPIALSRPFAVVASFATLLWLPIVAYFVGFHGDWSYLYLVPWQLVPSAIDLGLVLLSVAAVLAGFWLAVRPLRTRRSGPVVALVVAPSAVTVIGVMLSLHRLTISGTFAQFHGEFGTEPIDVSTLGTGVLLMGTLLTLGLAWTMHSLATMNGDTSS